MWVKVLKDKNISNKDLLNLIFQTLYTFFEVLVLSFKEPLISIVATDFVNFPVVRLINRKELVDGFVITTSSIFSQPLWMRNFNDKRILTHFINYSNNSLNFGTALSMQYHIYTASANSSESDFTFPVL